MNSKQNLKMDMGRIIFPFSAIEGQEEMKLTLILNAIDPLIGGVLIRGEKGTAKSTAVRALADILPEIDVRQGCPFQGKPDCNFCKNCLVEESDKADYSRPVRMTTLPLNSTEDMVVGSIDFEVAIKSGKKVFQPGVLAKVNRGILYVDEVNLLDDHIVDIILDSSSSGINIIEREGISFYHPCNFMLVGTMNPEEGDLRPQLIDRFGLCVNVEGSKDIGERVRLMKMRENFDQNPIEFYNSFYKKNIEIRDLINEARDRVGSVRISGSLKKYISELCLSRNVAGHRADIIIKRAAKALSAYRFKSEVTVDEILVVAEMALLHRTRESNNETPPPPQPENDDNEANSEEDPDDNNENDFDDSSDQVDSNDQGNSDDEEKENESEENQPDSEEPENHSQEESESLENDDNEEQMDSEITLPDSDDKNVKDEIFSIGDTFKVQKINVRKDRLKRRGSGRRSRTKTGQKQGRYIRSVLARNDSSDIAFDATIRAAASFQKFRKKSNDVIISIRKEDIRVKEREKKTGNLILFTVDASGSMGARGRMAASKGAVMSLLLDAYQKRDKVGMVSFRKKEAQLILPPTSSVDMAAGKLREMPVGGRTPLSLGLSKSFEILMSSLSKDSSSRLIQIIMTDGRSNYAVGGGKPMDEVFEYASKMSRETRIKYIVIDTEESGVVTFGLAKKLADSLGGDYFKIEDLKASDILGVINRSDING